MAGTWGGADSGATLTATNPATAQPIATVPLMGRIETERAIAAPRPQHKKNGAP
ncbi:hypothetical protein [Halothiobacillus sp. 15-55-196]|uniref:hypothetical protein n=1 Tax=Halothiobacillus sp. 15-55-196 TaxID=1970382 RepID=UPI0025C0BAB8|nr:hypothetical protein [Halothiobacillus sp. 15-55-196]